MNIKNFRLILLTADEAPSISGLNASQVFETAVALKNKGFKVTWIAPISIIEHLKNIITKRNSVNLVKRKCDLNEIEHSFFTIPLSLNLAFFLPIWTLYRKLIAKKISGIIKNGDNKSLIIHCRSYHAAGLAIDTKSIVDNESKWIISFDMRSILPEEIVLVRKYIGPPFYAKAKKWEYFLLKNSTVSFLPLKYGAKKAQIESELNIKYTPIQGFDREENFKPNFEIRWREKLIGYSGSIGAWHDPEILLKMFRSIPFLKPIAAMNPTPTLPSIECRRHNFEEMVSFYDKLLVLAIPGRVEENNFFVRFKMRCNFFSTKAAEALSRGVPLMVSSELKELADFVKNRRIGLIYDPHLEKIVYPIDDLNNKEVWAKLTENAFEVGLDFTREKVLDSYLAEWHKCAKSL